MKRVFKYIGKVSEILFNLSVSAFFIWIIANARDLIQFMMTLTTTAE